MIVTFARGYSLLRSVGVNGSVINYKKNYIMVVLKIIDWFRDHAHYFHNLDQKNE